MYIKEQGMHMCVQYVVTSLGCMFCIKIHCWCGYVSRVCVCVCVCVCGVCVCVV